MLQICPSQPGSRFNGSCTWWGRSMVPEEQQTLTRLKIDKVQVKASRCRHGGSRHNVEGAPVSNQTSCSMMRSLQRKALGPNAKICTKVALHRPVHWPLRCSLGPQTADHFKEPTFSTLRAFFNNNFIHAHPSSLVELKQLIESTA